jgi:hypothetical protein
MLAVVPGGSIDVIVMGLVVVVCSIVGFVRGRALLLALLFALYPAMLLTEHAPRAVLDLVVAGAYGRLSIFLAVLVGATYVLHRHVSRTFFLSTMWRWLEAVVLSLCVVGLGMTALYHSVNILTAFTFSPLADTLFLSPWAHALWLFAPLGALPLAVRP